MDVSAVTYAVAFTAGFLSFASPCVLALVPGYLSFISGVSFDQLGARSRDVMGPTAAFVGGFAVVFTAFGASAGLVGYSMASRQDTLNLIAGVLLILMGLAMVALPRIGMLQNTRRPLLARRPTTLAGASLVGAAFAVGWTPCIGPFLASVYTLALPSASPGLGASLFLVYSIGLGIPFLLAGLFVTRTMTAFRWLRDRWTVVNAASAAAVVVLGVLIATGRFSLVTQQLAGIGFQGI
jgi:cytochrome c-type biogenesis protein